jgi:hypothetical protein
LKTDELISLLASGSAAIAPQGARRLGPALGWGLAGSLLLMALLLGVRTDLAIAMHLPMFWAKLLVPVAAATTAFHMVRRLAVPGRRAGAAPIIIGALLALAWAGAAVALLSAPPELRSALVLGATWKVCTLNIFLLSLPLLAAALWAIADLAPTRPIQAGATAGLLAGAGAAAVYALHCPEMTAPFLGIWYVLGIAVPTAVGAVGGGRLLRW